ncbi:hypothetical protein [Acidiphilium sp.]|uniref:hypothetical protein n=1 Tax=Acidiphilium sp. TaxID=527 RepID=UPI0025842395|nr:hypothetical protein [Acidiphilium sp.]
MTDTAHDRPPLDLWGPPGQINGRAAANVELIRSWCRAACGPELVDDVAWTLAKTMNDLISDEMAWRDEFATARATDPARLRIARIVAARNSLIADLAAWEDANPHNREFSAQNRMLFDAAVAHKGSSAEFGLEESKPRPPHRELSRETIIAANLAGFLASIWTGHGAKKAIDAFVSEAMGWLTRRGQTPPPEKMRKARAKAAKR